MILPTKFADVGQAVKAWQAHLNALGATPALKVDGKHGPLTEAATVYHFRHQLERGIDVSHWQVPTRFDWATVAKAHTFGIARATYGTRIDKRYPLHVESMRIAGMTTGAYLFFRQTQSAEAQFEAFVKHANLRAGDMVPWVDLEYNTTGDDGPVDAEAHNTIGRKLCELLSKEYGACGVYLSPGHALELGFPDWLHEHHIWVAHWDESFHQRPTQIGGTVRQHRVGRPAWPQDWAIWQDRVKPLEGYPQAYPIDQNCARYLPLIEKVC